MPRFLRCLAFGAAMACAGIPPAHGRLDEALAKGDLATAEEELEKLAHDWQEEWETTRTADAGREYGLTLQALGTVERQAGKPAEALVHLEAAQPLLREVEDAARADALEALALTRQDLGDLDDAERDLRDVVRLRQDGPPLLQSRDHLALVLLAGGHYPDAGALLRENLAKTPPGDAVAKARRLGYLSRYLHTLGSHAAAAAMLREALALLPDRGELPLSLKSQLALAELRLGRVDEARKGLEAAVEEAAGFYRDRPFLAAPHWVNLGALELSRGDPEAARTAFTGALRLLESSLPPNHPSLIAPLNNLGCAEQAAGNLEQAEIHLRRAAALQAEHLPRLHLRVAETARNLARNALLAGSPDAGAEIDRATGLAIELLGELIRHGSERERLNFLQRLDLVSLPCATGDAERIASALLASKARLLDTMLAEKAAAEIPDWKQIQATLPEGSAFIDACRFLPEGEEAKERFGAVVLLPDGAPRWVTLGTEEDLQRWLAALRQRLAWQAGRLSGEDSPAPALRMRAILRSLHRGFWEPIARELPEDTRDVAFSPDGALHFLPLAALLDESSRPLCAIHRQVTTVSSARDLMAEVPEKGIASSPWAVFGVSDFPKAAAPAAGEPLLELLAGLDPMPGTADESRRIRALAPAGSALFSDGDATEATLFHLPQAPGVLHLGSHAFFLPQAHPAGTAVDFDEQAGLLFSGGLLLHGAALRAAESPLLAPDDDLLFPAEVARLPLQGTRLVTLSSCESGAGTAVSGEGVLGLRRGFALAGAREVVVALWPVSDRSTPAFMERFYRLALASDRPAQALWQCQREFLEQAATDDDFEAAVLRYGPFVIGQNTPLAASAEIVVTEKSRSPAWRSLWLGLPLLAFAAARWLRKKPA